MKSFFMIKKMLGLLLSQSKLINNILFNINRGYTCYVRVKGIGYKLEFLNLNTLSVNLGYSHLLNIKIPYFLKVAILKKE